MNASINAPSLMRAPGFWMALLMIASQLLNAVRALADPMSFAGYMGLSISNPADSGFVEVYALRAAFLGVFAAVLLFTRQIRALSLMALLAVAMAIGDALLTFRAGAATAIIVRHLLIGVFLLAAWFFLRRLQMFGNK